MSDMMMRFSSWTAAIGRGVILLAPGMIGAEPVDAHELPATQTARDYSPEQQVQLAEAYQKSAKVYELYAQGRYADALPFAEEALAIRRKVLGEAHPDTVTSLNDLAILLSTIGDYAAARPYYEQALAIRRKVLGDEHPDTARSLNNLGGLLEAMGDFAAARPHYEQALAICRKVVGEEHPDTAQLWANLGSLLGAMGDYAAARPCYEQALGIRRKVLGEEHPDTATSLNNLGFLLQATGDWAAARPYFEQALAIRRKVLGEEHPDTATSLNNLGSLFQAMGDYPAARTHLEQALAIHRKVLGDEHRATAYALNNLGVLLNCMGEYAAAREYYEQALAIRRKVVGNEHPETARSLNNLGFLMQAMGDYAAAQPLFEQSLAIRRKMLGEDHPDVAESLNQLGSLLRVTGNEAAARSYLEQALTIIAKQVEATAVAQDEAGQLKMSNSLRWYLDSYLSLAVTAADGPSAAYQAVLNFKGAMLLRQRAARMAEANPALAPQMAELRRVVREMSALVGSEPADRAALQGRLAELADQKKELERTLSRSNDSFVNATAAITISAVQAELPANSALVDYLEYACMNPSATTPGQWTLHKSLLAFVVEPGGDVHMFDLGATTPIAQAIAQWRTDYGATPDAEAAGALLREKLWTPLASAIGDAKLVLISPDGVLGTLPFSALPGRQPGEYLIEDVAVAFMPAPRMIPSLAGSRDDEPVDYELLVVGGVDYDRREAAAAPSQVEGEAIAPAVSHWAVRRAAEGLHWNALPGTSEEASAIGRLFQSMHRSDGASQPAMAELSGASATEEQFRELSQKCRILHVATHGFFAPELKRSTLAIDAERQSPFGLVTGRLSSPGAFPPGLLSGLVLAGANHPQSPPAGAPTPATPPEDGILTAEELSLLPLSNVRLAVLSACETGLGEVAGGEGLLGIQRAFQVAGARTTVASLWKVDDDATQRLMTSFYRNVLEERQSYLDALRNAQLEIIRDARASDAPVNPAADADRGAEAPEDEESAAPGSPYYWAAFTLSGDWR